MSSSNVEIVEKESKEQPISEIVKVESEEIALTIEAATATEIEVESSKEIKLKETDTKIETQTQDTLQELQTFIEADTKIETELVGIEEETKIQTSTESEVKLEALSETTAVEVTKLETNATEIGIKTNETELEVDTEAGIKTKIELATIDAGSEEETKLETYLGSDTETKVELDTTNGEAIDGELDVAVEAEILDPIIRKVPDSKLTPGRTNLRRWLSRYFRVVITDGRILIGIFNCTDKDANIVLAMCAEYLEEGGDARLLGNVMIPGKHIKSIEVDMSGHNDTT